MLAYPSPRSAALLLGLLALAAGGYWSAPLFDTAALGAAVLGVVMLADLGLTAGALRGRGGATPRPPGGQGMAVPLLTLAREFHEAVTVALPRQGRHILTNATGLHLRVQIHEDNHPSLNKSYSSGWHHVPAAQIGSGGGSPPEDEGRLPALPGKRATGRRPHRPLIPAIVRSEFSITPALRGELPLGGAGLRVIAGLGLWVLQYRFELGGRLRVYPLIEELARADLFAHRRRLYSLGEHRSRKFGRGTDFDRLREYTPDDEFRSINWNATARAGKPVVNQFHTDQSRELMLMLDCGRLMHTEIAGRSRLDRCLDAAIHLAYLALAQSDRVGLIAFDAQVRRHIAPGRRGEHLDRLINATFDLQPRFVESDYGRAVAELRSKHPKRGMVVLFTDMVDSVSSQSAVANLSRLARTHLPVIVILDDPAVHSLADAPAQTSQAAYVRAAAERFISEKRRALARLRTRGCLIVNVAADKLSGALVSEYLEAKARNIL